LYNPCCVLDGGFLQFGTPNTFSAAAFLGETDFNAIIVMPAYRLGVLGFLSSSEIEQDAASAGETVGNHGFWDQRLALEWTRDNIPLFGGNPLQVTISGYSAGESRSNLFEYLPSFPVHQEPTRSSISWPTTYNSLQKNLV
jgi:carboxylesterase type B